MSLKTGIVDDFDRARKHIIFTVRVKLSSWKMLPLRLASLGHWEASQRRGTIIAASHEWSALSQSTRQQAHPLCRRLLQEDSPLLVDLKACLHHPQAMLSDALRLEVARLVLLPTSERPMEGQHAFIHQAVKKAPHHSSVYVALKLLMPTIASMLDAAPESLQGFERAIKPNKPPTSISIILEV